MTLPASLEQNRRLGDWVSFGDDRIIIHTGKVELGQGIKTAVAIIAAEEFDVPIEVVTVRTGSTTSGPNEFMTAGSMSIETSGASVRQACAETRHHLLALAADRFGADASEIKVEDGLVKHAASNASVSWFELARELPPDLEATGAITGKPFTAYTKVGKTTTRLDLPAKFTGCQAFIQDDRTENLRHGRIVRPPSDAFRLVSIDTSEVEAMPGVLRVVVDGSFIGVIADSDYAAAQARSRLAALAEWQVDDDKQLPRGDLFDFLMSAPGQALLVVDGTPDPEVGIPERRPATIEAVYKKPYHMHASIGPSAAVAHYDGEHLMIKSHCQGPYVIRAAIASAVDMDPETIRVDHVENAGCYGHNGADDAAMDAALLALAFPGESILLKWEREDEHRWEPYSPAMALSMAATLEDGKVSWWNADVYSQTHGGRPRPFRSVTNLVAAWHRDPPMRRAEARPAIANHVGIHRNADPLYDFPERRIVKHLVTDQRVRTSSTRGLGAYGNVFAIESFMDELAHAAGAEPKAFRLAHLSDARAAEVIEKANSAADDFEPRAQAGWRTGRGMAFARYKNRQTYAAVVVFLRVNEETFDIRLDHAVIAADAGQVIDADGLANQLEGGLIQAASWTLLEAVKFDEFATASVDWESYPILRFPDIPTVDVHLLDRPDSPSLGAGEATQGPAPAAIANAIFDAIGLRVREIPFTPDRLRSIALEA